MTELRNFRRNFRNDRILNEIASAFSKPRNDGISAMTDEFRIYCDEILGSSPRMTKKVKSGDDTGLGNSGILRDCFGRFAPSQ